MATMQKLVQSWAGTPVVGLAVGVHYFVGESAGFTANVKAAYDALVGVLPNVVTVTTPTGGDDIDDATGTLIGAYTDSGGGGVTTGTTSPACASGVGACVNWLTNGVVNGRRVRGRTFIVPMAASQYDSNGTLVAGAVTSLQNFGAAMSALGLVVWHRPTGPGLSDGSSHAVTGFSVRDKVAILTSRRD